MLKFDFFFIFGTQLQVLLADRKITNQGFIVQAAAIPVAIVSLVLAARFCRLEKTKSLICMMVRTQVLAVIHIILQVLTDTIPVFDGRDHRQFCEHSASSIRKHRG